MNKNPHFKLRPLGEYIIIKRMKIKSNEELKASRLDLITAQGKDPKNIIELENRKAAAQMKYEEAEDKFKSTWPQNPAQAIVIAVGPGKRLGDDEIIPNTVKVGDRVYLRGNVGEPILYKNEVYFMVKEYDLFCVDPEPFKEDKPK